MKVAARAKAASPSSRMPAKAWKLWRHAESPGSTFRFDGWSDSVFLDAERGALEVVFTGEVAPPLALEGTLRGRLLVLAFDRAPVGEARRRPSTPISTATT